jgi:hypothetical protein
MRQEIATSPYIYSPRKIEAPNYREAVAVKNPYDGVVVGAHQLHCPAVIEIYSRLWLVVITAEPSEIHDIIVQNILRERLKVVQRLQAKRGTNPTLVWKIHISERLIFRYR